MKNSVFLYFLILSLGFLCNSISYAQKIDKKEKLFYSYNDSTKMYSIEDFKGKYVLLDFWGLGCKPCLMAIPEMIEIQKKYADKLLILGINDKIFLERLDEYVKKTQINYPIVHTKDFMKVYYQFSKNEFYGFPYYVLLSPDGDVIDNKYYYAKLKDFFDKK